MNILNNASKLIDEEMDHLGSEYSSDGYGSYFEGGADSYKKVKNKKDKKKKGRKGKKEEESDDN
jgi:hypothetical protein